MYIFLSYILLINLVTFVVRGIDKYRARKNQWRIAEQTLLLLVAAGGIIGALSGMSVWRHKTIKGSFLRKFWLLGLLWLCLMCFFLYRTTL